jgi:hypothetical protein
MSCVQLGGLPSDNKPAPDPDGDMYIMGYCKCDFPEVEFLAEEFIGVILPALGSAICATWYSAVKEIFETSLEIGASFIPVLGPEASIGLRMATQGAKTLAENGGTAANFLSWYQNPCGPRAQDEMDAISGAFNPLSAATDASGIALPIPCPKGKKCGKKTRN